MYIYTYKYTYKYTYIIKCIIANMYAYIHTYIPRNSIYANFHSCARILVHPPPPLLCSVYDDFLVWSSLASQTDTSVIYSYLVGQVRSLK